MDDLSHWDCATIFTVNQIAHLAAGIDPNTVAYDSIEIKAKPMFDKVRLALLFAITSVQKGMEADKRLLYPVEMPDGEAQEQHCTKTSVFNRKDIAIWLRNNGIKSVYQFDLAAPVITGRWPWGDHHTELLGHLEAAANKFWVNYDPTDATTAPTNKMVIDWLRGDEREVKVSQKMAEAIASMLRPDDLPTGPRT